MDETKYERRLRDRKATAKAQAKRLREWEKRQMRHAAYRRRLELEAADAKWLDWIANEETV